MFLYYGPAKYLHQYPPNSQKNNNRLKYPLGGLIIPPLFSGGNAREQQPNSSLREHWASEPSTPAPPWDWSIIGRQMREFATATPDPPTNTERVLTFVCSHAGCEDIRWVLMSVGELDGDPKKKHLCLCTHLHVCRYKTYVFFIATRVLRCACEFRWMGRNLSVYLLNYYIGRR